MFAESASTFTGTSKLSALEVRQKPVPPQSEISIMASETSRHGDLEWLAFQYAAGELHGAELEAFELRLACDLASCEALAKAVLLSQAIAVCESQMPVASIPESPRVPPLDSGRGKRDRHQDIAVMPVGGKSTRHPISWPGLALVGSAACLALMANWFGSGISNPRGSHSTELTAGVVSLWIDGVESNGGFATSEQTSPLPNEAIADATDSVTDELRTSTTTADGADLDNGDDDAIPGWMLAAVAQRQHELADPEQEVLQD